MGHRIAAVLLLTVALLTTLGWTGQCWAQTKIARIGFLTPASGGPRTELVEALRTLGYVEGQTTTFLISDEAQPASGRWAKRRHSGAAREGRTRNPELFRPRVLDSGFRYAAPE
jgi:hypothetical protein